MPITADESAEQTGGGRRARRFPKVAAKVGKTFIQCLGPGLITGASDDDPSGVATYSQAGAQFGFGMLWIALFSLPLMSAIQEISARIGRITGRGIAANLRQYYSRWLSIPIVVLLIIANTLNIGADIGAMGAATKMLVHRGSPLLYSVAFALVSLLLQIFLKYCDYARVLKWLCLVLFTYVGVIFTVRIPWGQALRYTLVPHMQFNAAYISLLVAMFGTTISPYLFFWQASLEVEDLHAAPGEVALDRAPKQARAEFRRIRLDTYSGMAFSNLISFFIVLTAAVTLNQHNVKDIQTAEQAASALGEIVGPAAKLLFTAGIVGTGLLAVPVLAGSAAYALGELLKWPTGLERKPRQAKGFYGILAVATLLGTLINFTPIDPIKALIWTAVINGVVAVPVMIVMMLMAGNAKVMGHLAHVSKPLRVVGWIATGVMLAAVVGMFATMGR